MSIELIDKSGDMHAMPEDWPHDALSSFLDDARHNLVASVSNLRDQYRDLAEIDRSFGKIVDNLTQASEVIAALFLYRSRSSYRGAVRLGLSGQLAEANLVSRSCLECALYGLYVKGEHGRQETWLRRHDDDKARKRVRNEFSATKLMEHLKGIDPETQSIAHRLYEDAVDHGGHPNERSLLMSVDVRSTEKRHEFRMRDFLCGDIAQLATLKMIASVGICSLDIFKHVFPERFAILGIDEIVDRVRRAY